MRRADGWPGWAAYLKITWSVYGRKRGRFAPGLALVDLKYGIRWWARGVGR